MAEEEVTGIHQSDVVIRSAIQAALNDMRANPWLLNYAFAGLAADALTADEYGQSEIDKAKAWFQKTKIKVQLNVNPSNTATYPCVSITLMSSAEQEQEGALADTHYVPFEDTEELLTLLGPLALGGYDASTGVLTLNATEVGDFVLAPSMNVQDESGALYPILEVLSDNVVRIKKGVTTSLSKLYIMSARASQQVQIGSAVYRETYAIGCHVNDEPIHLIYLHSIMVFALLSYKKSLLEARGFERSVLNSQDLKRDDEFLPEFFYDRYIQITGSVRQSWPISIAPTATAVQLQFTGTPRNLDTPIVSIIPNLDEAPPDADIPGIPAPANAQTVYWGEADLATVDADFVRGLASSAGQVGRQSTLSFNAGATQYCWYAIPASFGGVPEDFVDQETALVAGWSKVATIYVGADLYNVWRSDEPDLGAVTIVVF